MRYGICIEESCLFENNGKRKASMAKDAGFDYLEFGASRLWSLSDECFESVANANKESDIKAECVNGYMPASIRITGEGVDYGIITEYLEKMLSRLNRLGIKKAIFGSAASRNVPDGFSYDKAYEQIVRFLSDYVSKVADKYDIVTAIEPLSDGNIIHTVEEALALCKLVGRDNIKVMGDIYHMNACGESYDIFKKCGSDLRHIHFCNPSTRMYPLDISEFDYSNVLSGISGVYDSSISVEAIVRDFDTEVFESGKFMRTYVK